MLRSHKRDDLDFCDDLLVRVGLADLADRPVGMLSGGELQRDARFGTVVDDDQIGPFRGCCPVHGASAAPKRAPWQAAV